MSALYAKVFLKIFYTCHLFRTLIIFCLWGREHIVPKGMWLMFPSLFPFCKAKLLSTVTKIKPRGQKSHRHCHGNSLTIPLADLWKQSFQQDFTALALWFSKLFMQLMRGTQPTLYTQFKSTCWWYKKECWTTGFLHLLQNYQHKPWGICSWNVNRTVWGIRSVHELCFDPMSVQKADLTTCCLVTW